MRRQIIKIIVLGYLTTTGVHIYSQDTISNKNPVEISILEAINSEVFEIKIRGTYDPWEFHEVVDDNGIYYGKCINIILKSKVDTLILIRLDCGIQLIPIDSAVQTMLITKKVILPLYPKKLYATRVYAMCGQMHYDGPDISKEFKVGDFADTGLVRLAKYLDDNYLQNMLGQHAIWAYTDQAKMDELTKYGADSSSIDKTKEILDNLNLETKLTQRIKTPLIEEPTEVTINLYYIYGGVGLIFVLTIIVVLLIKKRNSNSNKFA